MLCTNRIYIVDSFKKFKQLNLLAILEISDCVTQPNCLINGPLINLTPYLCEEVLVPQEHVKHFWIKYIFMSF